MTANRSTSVRHPLFARFYARMSAGAEAKGAQEHREELLDGLTGRVIEIGAGNGLNLEHYPAGVAEVVAIEPEPFLRRQAIAAAARAIVPVRAVDGVADALPAEDGAFDAAVCSLVLCSVDSPARTLSEVFRAIRPGGELRFYEHVRAADPRWARFQHRIAPIWRRFGGGCHPDRPTVDEIRTAGFEIEHLREFLFVPEWIAKPVAPHVIGRARRPEPGSA